MTRRSAALLFVAILPASFAQSKDEDRIYDEVRRVLALDADVRGAAIMVEVKTDGMVVLSGRVRNEKAREKATKLAKKVKGVKEVTNLLKLPDEK